jgi:pyruvate/oxaloacetate carboxyltransferase
VIFERLSDLSKDTLDEVGLVESKKGFSCCRVPLTSYSDAQEVMNVTRRGNFEIITDPPLKVIC